MVDAERLRRDVVEELMWDARVEASNILVITDADGVVTLMGDVPSHIGKVAAERAVKRLRGVKAVANELNVVLAPEFQRDDSAIARAALNALSSTRAGPQDQVRVTVDHGRVTLDGEVKSHEQKREAEEAVRPLVGVTGLVSRIAIVPDVEPIALQQKIEMLFRRRAWTDAEKLRVKVAGGRITLRGTVRSWAEREEAVEAAWSTPGVREVDDLLEVDVLAPAGPK